MILTTENLRRLVIWSGHYRSAWDDEPDRYLETCTVKWGRSRRLGLFQSGRQKAYLGVQHVDPKLPGWAGVGEARTRYFVSIFADGQCLDLRTARTMSEALGLLSDFLASYGGAG